MGSNDNLPLYFFSPALSQTSRGQRFKRERLGTRLGGHFSGKFACLEVGEKKVFQDFQRVLILETHFFYTLIV